MQKVILDTDIGDDVDDAFALALALKCEEIDLIGVTTVFRNTLRRAKLARAFMKTFHADVKTYAGCGVPLLEEIHYFERDVLDANGESSPCQYAPEMSGETVEEMHAVDFIIRSVRAFPGEITVVAIGPYTNIAMALRKAPDIAKQIKKVVVMGGHMGRAFPEHRIGERFAEWNIQCDPEAARILYTSGVELYQVSLDVTMQCVMQREVVNALENSRKQSGHLLRECTRKWSAHLGGNNPVMHDPLAVSVLVKDFCEFQKKYIRVGLAGEERARTIVSNAQDKAASEIYVAQSVRAKEFIDFLTERIS